MSTSTRSSSVVLAVSDADEQPRKKAAKKAAPKTKKAEPAPATTVSDAVVDTPTPTLEATTTKTSAKKAVAKKATAKKTTIKEQTTKKATVKKTPAKKTATKKATTKTVAKKTNKVAPAKATTPAPVATKLSKKDVMRSSKREPLGHLLVEQMLREGGFRGGISSDKELLEKYSTDESIFSIKPQVVIQPKGAEDVEKAVRIISEHTAKFPSLSLTPRAAGTGLSGGSLTDSIVMDVRAHIHKIFDVVEKKSKITFSCEPGAMWRDVEKKLKQHDAYLPSYPASKDICSIGGSIGNNAAGPDSLRYGHCADWVESLDVVLHDGNTYTIKPLSYKEFTALIKKDNAHAQIAAQVFDIIAKNEKAITGAKPHTKKNTAGYPLWDVLDVSVSEFKKGKKGTFDLTRLVSGSQGTIGIITKITMRAEPIAHDTTLIVVPVFDLQSAGNVILEALKYEPINVELFDGLTYNLALKNPSFFKDRLSTTDYCRVILSMYTTFHVRYGGKVPEFTLLVTLDAETARQHNPETIVKSIQSHGGKRARVVTNRIHKEMFWQIRRASYTLSKFQDPNKRPAAFLEDMTVPPKNLPKFFMEIKKLLQKYNITAAVHGHGGNGHLHFYPLLDFTSATTPKLVEKMANEFFEVAIKYDGNICGEHNDGIIRTPHLSKMYDKKVLGLFEQLEALFDPQDIFNPGKKVNPRFDVKESIRKKN